MIPHFSSFFFLFLFPPFIRTLQATDTTRESSPTVIATLVPLLQLPLGGLGHWSLTVSSKHMIDNLSWGTFILWGLFDIIIATGCFFFVKETNGLSLEEAAQPNVFNRDYKFEEDTTSISETLFKPSH